MRETVRFAPAKLNLGLWVGRRRPDGFHEVLTTLVPLEFGDTVRITRSGPGLKLKLRGIKLPIPVEKNLAGRAATLFFSELRLKPACTIEIVKRIPPGAGLGGGSSDAAAVLLGLNALFSPSLPRSTLFRLARRLGSDVPFFLHSAPCVARGRGEKLRKVLLPALHFALLLPGFGVDTAWAYRMLDYRRKLTPPKISPKILALKLRRNELTGIAAQLENSFEPLVFRHHPELATARRWLLEHGACAAGLSGSGSTVYGLFAGPDPMAEMRMRREKPRGFSILFTRSRPTVRPAITPAGPRPAEADWGVV